MRKTASIILAIVIGGIFVKPPDIYPQSCTSYTIPVSLTARDSEKYNIVGELCRDEELQSNTVQVLVAGSTYGSYYWDFPYEPEKYSYVQRAVKDGYTVFNFDRIGLGQSDHPPLFTFAMDSYVVYQIIQALRNGEIGDTEFDKVILVGHSLGTNIVLDVAVRYPDTVDGLIYTGLSHISGISKDFVSQLATGFVRASEDPKFEDEDLSRWYQTTKDGIRGFLFYYTPTADPEVIALDEELKQTAMFIEKAPYSMLPFFNASYWLTCPVLYILADNDGFYCSDPDKRGAVDCTDPQAVEDYEKKYFANAADFETHVIEDTGHSINLHTTCQEAYDIMIDWVDRH